MARSGHNEQSDDASLLAAIGDRDGRALSIFYRRHLPAVLRFLLRETADPEVAADLAAEVFAAVMLGARRYRPQHATAGPWVIGIARNQLGASRRRGRIEDHARRRLGFEPAELEDPDLERVIELAGGGAVARLVQQLPPDERRAVVERVVRERDYPEIASELRCSEMVIRKRVSRGLARLRQQLEER
jgi:RNA polymerase sigma factor (sigma-70 family)